MELHYNDRVFARKTNEIISIWKWILLYLVKTYKCVDYDGNRITIVYVKRLFKELYFWKRETFEAGRLIEKSKLKRVEE